MPAEAVALFRIGPRQLVSWLLQQPGRTGPSVARGSRGLSCLPPPPSLTPGLGTGGRRSQPRRSCSGGVPDSPCRPTPRHNKSPLRLAVDVSRAAPLCLHSSPHAAFCSSDSHSSGRGSNADSAMSSNPLPAVPKPKSPFRKRGSLQNTASPGECGEEGGPGMVGERRGGGRGGSVGWGRGQPQ
ncbi:hypothetical protein MATL_G00071980 [Megalops atlanticus]|uniref:Uncharacterized protein n=1 Tax=Megalops atlanticus TaxID=7932 RepID=A0A9D3T8Z6_MEGAT|nr:hypothetical protein MATL_G00071980 [Megalops atlanticus]